MDAVGSRQLATCMRYVGLTDRGGAGFTVTFSCVVW